MNNKSLLNLINSVKEKIKDSDVIKDMFKEYNVDLSELDLFPICFGDLDVSARTDHGIIFLNKKLLDNIPEDKWPSAIDHYLVHEICHVLQQTTGQKPTKGADSGSYLDNAEEIEGFNNQTEYIADTRSEDVAEQYIDQVLDHHDVEDKDREKKKDQLLSI